MFHVEQLEVFPTWLWESFGAMIAKKLAKSAIIPTFLSQIGTNMEHASIETSKSHQSVPLLPGWFSGEVSW